MKSEKAIWTTISAAAEIEVSTRTLRRMLKELGIQPTKRNRDSQSAGGGDTIHILGRNEMELLRELHRQRQGN